MHRYSIGIDPGKKTGLAVYDRVNKNLIRLDTTTFWGAYSTILTEYHDVFAVAVEVPRSKHNWHSNGAAVDVGGICREANLLADGLELAGLNVIRQHPKGKISSAQFKKITGWTGRSNEHNRDAAMLCFGL